MIETKMNKEGMTFEEWAYVARCAKFRGENFLPMEEGSPRRYNYPKRIRDAWANGICPTDWMLDAQKNG